MPQLGQGSNMWRPGNPYAGASRLQPMPGDTMPMMPPGAPTGARGGDLPGDSLGTLVQAIGQEPPARNRDGLTTGVGNQIQELGGSLGGSLGSSRPVDLATGLPGGNQYQQLGGSLGGLAGLAGGSRLGGGRFGMPGDTFDAGGRSPELLRQQYAALSPDEQSKYAGMYKSASPGMQASVLGAMGLGGGGREIASGVPGVAGWTAGGSLAAPGGISSVRSSDPPGLASTRVSDYAAGAGDAARSSAVGPAQAAALGRGQDAWRGLKGAYGGGGSAGWQDFKQGQQQAGTFDALKSRTLGGGPAAGTAAAGGFGGAPMGSFGGGGGRAPAAGPTAAGGFGPPAAPRGGFGVGAPGSQPFGGSLGGLQGLAGGFGGRKRPGQATEEYAG